MIKATTALNKILGLKKRIKVIQGGQGAGKTYSILMMLIDYASAVEKQDIYIASKELSKMRTTVIKDFKNIMFGFGLFNPHKWNKSTNTYEFKNGSVINFLGLDKEDIGKGLRSDMVFVNEANKVPYETFRELTSRARRVIVDYNPNSEFWVHTEVLDRDDADFLILTYKDNEFLSKEEVAEIELNRTRAYFDPTLPEGEIDKADNIKNKYYLNKWLIYGKGVVGANPNRIFFWNTIDYREYKKLDVPKFYGVDWGAVDPFAVVECKYYDGALYLHELNYKSENQIREGLSASMNTRLKNEDEGLIKWLFSKFAIEKQRPIICDNNRPEKIKTLRKMGYGYALATTKGKGSILSGIDLLSGIDVYYTSTSKNISFEQRNYARKVDRYGVILEEPEDEYNHTMDAIRYVALFLMRQGIINTI
jgi:phage terminase large subunit